MYLVRYLAFKVVYDFCSCTGATTPAPLHWRPYTGATTMVPPGYMSVRLLLFTHSSPSLTTPFKSSRCCVNLALTDYTTFNGQKIYFKCSKQLGIYLHTLETQ